MHGVEPQSVHVIVGEEHQGVVDDVAADLVGVVGAREVHLARDGRVALAPPLERERDVAALGDGGLDYRDENPAFRELDALSIAQWLDHNDVGGWLRKLITVAYTTEMGLEIEAQSALNLLTFIGTDDEDVFKVFGESDERFHVRGGNDLIVQRLADKVDDAIESGHVLEAVASRGDGYVLSFRRGAASRDR